MTTASKITLVRVVMIPAYLITMYLSGGTSGLWMYISLAIFIVASLTDFLDGYIARHYNQTSGKFLHQRLLFKALQLGVFDSLRKTVRDRKSVV